MAKGKTNQPLAFVVPQEWMETELFKKLLAQGHSVQPMPPACMEADVIFGVNCHWMTDEMMSKKGLLDLVLKTARKRKKEKKNG